MVVAGVHLHQQGGVFIDGRRVVPLVGAVGGAHFPQPAPGLRHHVRDAKRPADLHQLSPGNHHLFTAGGRGQHQQHRRGVVIHNAGIFRPGELAQQRRQRPIAMAAPGPIKIVLQGNRRLHRLGYRSHRLLSQQRAPQISVQHRSRQVDDRTQPLYFIRRQPLFGLLRPVVTPGRQAVVGADPGAGFVLQLAQGFDRSAVTKPGNDGRKTGVAKQTIGRGKLAIESVLSSHESA